MHRAWPRVRAFDGVVLALEVQGAGAAPEGMDDLHRLFQGLDRLAPAASRPAHGLDALTKGARAQAKLDSPAAEHIQCSRGFGQHGGRTQWQIRDIGEDMHALRGLEQRGDEGPGLQKPGVLWMVLNANIL